MQAARCDVSGRPPEALSAGPDVSIRRRGRPTTGPQPETEGGDVLLPQVLFPAAALHQAGLLRPACSGAGA